jgi:hypothetical protein
MYITAIFILVTLSSINAYMVTKMMLGDILKKVNLVKDTSYKVEFVKGEESFTTTAMKGEKLSAVAEKAGGLRTS